MKRRDFFRRLSVPVLALGAGTGRIHFYSISSKVGQWAGWIEDRGGRVIAFFTKSGKFLPFP